MNSSLKYFRIALVFLVTVLLVLNVTEILLVHFNDHITPSKFPLPDVEIPADPLIPPTRFVMKKPPGIHRSNTSDTGYVLATHFSDQLAGSTANAISFQCWASTIPGNIRVVEPFLHYGSLLGFDLNPLPENASQLASPVNGPHYVAGQKHENTIRASDVFDLTQWHRFIDERGFSSFISWEQFLFSAPRQLIIVDQVCGFRCMTCSPNSFFESDLFAKFAENFARFFGFDIVRRSCYTMKIYSQAEFQDLVYGPYNPQDSVVVFNHFGGVERRTSMYRIRVDLKRCDWHKFHVDIGMSSQMLQQSAKYVAVYMPEARISGYVSIMLRMEQFALTHKLSGKSKHQQAEILETCLSSVFKQVKNLQEGCKISDVFISTDVAKYGSAYLRTKSHYFHHGVLESALDRLYQNLYGNSSNRETMMRRMEEMVLVESPGYVALLESTIAANGTCLLLVGGGRFQEHAKKLYKNHFWKKRLKRKCGVEFVQGC